MQHGPVLDACRHMRKEIALPRYEHIVHQSIEYQQQTAIRCVQILWQVRDTVGAMLHDQDELLIVELEQLFAEGWHPAIAQETYLAALRTQKPHASREEECLATVFSLVFEALGHWLQLFGHREWQQLPLLHRLRQTELVPTTAWQEVRDQLDACLHDPECREEGVLGTAAPHSSA